MQTKKTSYHNASAKVDLANNENFMSSDLNYIQSLNAMLKKECDKGNDVTQLAEGDILVTEKRTVYTQYSWNKEESKFLKKSSAIE